MSHVVSQELCVIVVDFILCHKMNNNLTVLDHYLCENQGEFIKVFT